MPNFSKHSFTQASSLLDLVHSGVYALQEILTFLIGNFWSKKPPIWHFCLNVQLDQSAILV